MASHTDLERRLAHLLVRALRVPGLDVAAANDLAEAAVRLALSHIVLPLHPTEQAAAQIARIVEHHAVAVTGRVGPTA